MIDNSNIKIISHILIRDPDTDQTYLKMRDVARVPVQEEIAPENEPDSSVGSDCNE
jgi:hypothetical protein